MEDKSCPCPVSLDDVEKLLRDELEDIKLEVNDLYKTVYKGNGTPALTTRISTAEGKIRGLRETMDEKINHITRENTLKFDSIHEKLESKFSRLEGRIDSKFEDLEKDISLLAGSVRDMAALVNKSKDVDRAGAWQLKAATLTAGISLIAAVVVVLFK